MFRHVPALAAEPVSVSGSNLTWVIIVAVVALLALGVAGVLVREVLAAGQGTQRMQEIARAVQEGAAAYLRRQFRTLGIFVIIIFFVLLVLPADGASVQWGRSIFFLVGALFSAVTGFVGMTLTTRGNVRAAAAARGGGERRAFRIAFRTGGVAGMFTVGLGLLGAAIVVLIYRANAPGVLEGFGFGAALLALFMRVGGGIYTKAADVGADLVGKVEQGIPEDDPRNAATIADNVGDNVGDCAGMAADLFETYAVTTVAPMVLAAIFFRNDVAHVGAMMLLPLAICAVCIVTSIIGTFAVRLGKSNNIMGALYQGLIVTGVLSVGAVWVVVNKLVPGALTILAGTAAEKTFDANALFGCGLVGLAVTALIVVITEYYTGTGFNPVKAIAKASVAGHGTNVIQGLAVSLESTAAPALVIIVGIIVTYKLAGLFGIAIATTTILSLAGFFVVLDAICPA